MANYVDRMIEESSQLEERLGKLSLFIESEDSVFNELPPVKQELLRTQYTYMTHYAAILTQRIRMEQQGSEGATVETEEEENTDYSEAAIMQ